MDFGNQFWTNIRLAIVKWKKRPLVPVIIVLTLAIGVGLNTAMFSVLQTTLFRKLPYPDAKSLVLVQMWSKQDGAVDATSYPRYREWERNSRLLKQVAGVSPQDIVLSQNNELEPVSAEFVSASYFPTLQENAALGRTFTREEADETGAHVAVLSYELWKRRFGLDSGILGKAITINDQLFAVIGVMPKGARGISRNADIWLPITAIGVSSTADLLRNDVAIWVTVVGRLAPGATVPPAQDEIAAINSHYNRSLTQSGNDSSVKVAPLQYAAVENYRTGFLLLFGAAFMVLLIACVNVSTVLLSYFFERNAEFAIRQVFGATRLDLLKQLAIESTILSLFGGVTGVVFAVLSTRWLGAEFAGLLPASAQVNADWHALAFALALSLATGIVLGIVCAQRLERRALFDSLREAAKMTSSVAKRRERSILIIGQLSVAMVLLVAAGLMLRTMVNLQRINLGFDADDVMVVRMSTLPASYSTVDQMARSYETMLRNVSESKGVASAGAVTSVPLMTPSPTIPFVVQGHPVSPGTQPPVVHYLAVTGNYFAAIGIGLQQGRVFDAQDLNHSVPVAIINATMAKRYWPGENPIGQQITIWDGGPARRVVGVVNDIRDAELRTPSAPQAYLPLNQVPDSFASMIRSFPPSLVVKTASANVPFSAAARTILRRSNPDITIISTSRLSDVVTKSIAGPRLYRNLFSGFAAIALILAIIGMYGIVARAVAQQTTEIGVRLAMGASRLNILLLVLRPAMLLTICGLTLGAFCAWLLSRAMSSMLFGVVASDSISFLVSGLILLFTALVACYFLANRAAHVDPVRALRYE